MSIQNTDEDTNDTKTEDDQKLDNDKKSDDDAKVDTHNVKDKSIQEDGLSLRKALIRDAPNSDISEIVPIVAIPYSQPVHSIAVTKGPKWLFTGGEDGIIRKFDFFASVEGKAPLTVAQRHLLVDSISFGGYVESYWENEQPYYKEELLKDLEQSQSKTKAKKTDSSSITMYEPKLSPVYSLAASSEGFWLLSGLKSGGITVQTTRSNEGSIQYYFKDGEDRYQHSNAVSCLKLNSDETRFLSGSWDKKILQWDLNTGKCTNVFDKSTGQVSSIDCRPLGSIDLSLCNSQQKNKDDEKEEEESLFGDTEESQDNKTEFQKDMAKDSKTSIQKGTYEGLARSDHVFVSSSINGIVNIWDNRLPKDTNQIATVGLHKDITPWCMSAIWSSDGNSIFIGRKSSVIEEFDFRNLSDYKNLLRFPFASGPVSCVRSLPNKNYLLCGCEDNIRIYDLRLSDYDKETHEHHHHHHHHKRRRKVPFMIVPGHNGGILSDIYVDPTSRFMISASGNRGWQGKASDYVFIYEIQKC